MTPADICRMVYDAGMTMRLRGEKLVLVPADKLTPELRTVLLEHKFAVIQFLKQAQATTAAVIDLAMRLCDQHADGEQARADMVRDVEQTPPHLRADLLDYFRKLRPGFPLPDVRRVLDDKNQT